MHVVAPIAPCRGNPLISFSMVLDHLSATMALLIELPPASTNPPPSQLGLTVRTEAPSRSIDPPPWAVRSSRSRRRLITIRRQAPWAGAAVSVGCFLLQASLRSAHAFPDATSRPQARRPRLCVHGFPQPPRCLAGLGLFSVWVRTVFWGLWCCGGGEVAHPSIPVTRR